MKNKVADNTANSIIKSIVVITGGICILTVFVVDKLGSILQLALSVGGVTGGASLGLFSFGMFYPRGNSKGALAGSISSLIFMSWVVFGTQTAIANGSMKQKVLPTNADGCGFNETIPELQQNDTATDDVFILYRVSFMYYTFIGMAVVFIVGVIVSLLTEPPNLQEMNPALFTPIVRNYVERKIRGYVVKESSEMERLNIETHN
ncbi:Sodium-coupled monocarboxylate transporter 2 [Zootermopsis nevadensis]|uniref:Sodium-coupled monocarboxylate transporter 2 n=2 Tax=Zootermopsis nevadensis TaxID=136037 RepID=A0A067REL6_ZOONE|nr:Sodium-coupled monocarboxylate transporter 2 [Zootermopsis nevadensis]